MKVTKETFDRIKNKEQTIGLIKVSKLADLMNNENNDTTDVNNKGRFYINLFNENDEYLGKITINGYQIIKNPFNFELSKNENTKEFQLFDIKNKLFKEGNFWIIKYFEELKEYFKDEEEILILNIESVNYMSRKIEYRCTICNSFLMTDKESIEHFKLEHREGFTTND